MSKAYSRELLAGLPLPLAQLYHRAHNEPEFKQRHDNAYYLLEAWMRLAAIVGVAGYAEARRAGAPPSESLARTIVRLHRPLTSDWRDLLRGLADYFSARSNHPLQAVAAALHVKRRDGEVLDLYRRIKNGVDSPPSGDSTWTVLELCDALVRFRNELFHGAARQRDFYEELSGRLAGAAGRLFSEPGLALLGPPKSRLVIVEKHDRTGDDLARVQLYELTGSVPDRLPGPLEVPPADAAELLPNRIAVWWPDRRQPLSLYPFLAGQLEEGPYADVSFLNFDDGKKTHYLNYRNGEKPLDSGASQALAAAIDAIAGPAAPPAPAASPAPAVPEYQMLAVLGQGGMGVVHLARQTALDRLVAVKTLPELKSADQKARKQFEREVRLLSRFEHPHIVRLYQPGQLPNGVPCYSMEYVAGCDLERVFTTLTAAAESPSRAAWDRAVREATLAHRDELRQQNAETNLDPIFERDEPLARAPEPNDGADGYVRHVAALFRDAARAVEAVHAKKVLHRDVKPANLMISPDGRRLILMDFGLAKSESLGLTTHRETGLLGTLRYAAPEQFDPSFGKVGEATDVRSLGATFWELLVRRRLYPDARTETDLIREIPKSEVPPARTVVSGFDPDLDVILDRALERRVADRIPTAKALADHLDDYLAGRPVKLRRRTAVERAGRWLRRHAVAATIVCGIALAAGGGLFAWNRHQDAKFRTGVERLIQDGTVALDTSDFDLARERLRKADSLIGDREDFAGERERMQRLVERVDDLNPPKLSEVLAKMRLGSQQIGKNNATGALPYFVAALDLVRESAPIATDIRQQIGAVLRIVPRPAQRWTFDAAGRVSVFRPDGLAIAFGLDDGAARIVDATTGAKLLEVSHGKPLRAIAWAPDGKKFATGGTDGIARIWDAATGRPIGEPMQHEDPVHALDFSADGTKLATGSGRVLTTKTVTEYRAETYTVQSADGKPEQRTRQVPIQIAKTVEDDRNDAPGGNPLFAGTGGAAQIWDAATCKPLSAPMRQQGRVQRVAFADGGRQLVTAIMQPSWDAPVPAPPAPAPAVMPAPPPAPAADDKSPAPGKPTTRSGALQIWSLDGPPKQRDAPLFDATFGIDFLHVEPSGRLLATAGRASESWDIRRGKALTRRFQHGAGLAQMSVGPPAAIGANGLGYAGGYCAAFTSGKTVLVWIPKPGPAAPAAQLHPQIDDSPILAADLDQLPFPPKEDPPGGETNFLTEPSHKLEHDAPVRALAFNGDGTLLATGCEDGSVRIWSVRFGTPAFPPLQHAASIARLQFAPDSRHLLVEGRNARATLWDLADELGQAPTLDAAAPFGPALAGFAPDNSIAYTVRQTHPERFQPGPELQLWDAVTGLRRVEARRFPAPINQVLFSPHGRWMLTIAGETIVVAETQSKLRSDEWSIPIPRPAFILFDDRETRLVLIETTGKEAAPPPPAGERSRGPHWSARVWDLATRQVIAELPEQSGSIDGANVGADGTTLIAWNGNAARLWQIEGNRFVERPNALGGQSVQFAVFSSDGRRLVTRSDEKTLHLWDAATLQPIDSPAPLQMPAPVRFVSFSADGSRMLARAFAASKDTDGNAEPPLDRPTFWCVYRTDNGARVTPMIPAMPGLFFADLSADGRYVIATGDGPNRSGFAQLFSAATGAPVMPPVRLANGIRAVAVDGKRNCLRLIDGWGRLDAVSLLPTDLPRDQLQGLAQVLSGRSLPQGDSIDELSAEALDRAWAQAKGAISPLTDDQLFAWHRDEAASAAQDYLYDVALRQLARAMQLRPDDPELKIKRAEILAELGRRDEALAAITAVPTDGEKTARIAQLKTLLILYPERQALPSPLARASAADGIGRGMRSLDRWESVSEFASAAILVPEAVKDWQPLIGRLVREVEASAGDCNPRHALGAVLYRAGQFKDAQKYLTEADSLCAAKLPRNSLFLSMTYHRLNKPKEARQWFDKAVERLKEDDAPLTWSQRLGFTRRADAEILIGEARALLKAE